ncbi:MAG: hypothetical protein ACP5M1_00050 [Acidiphilium sp.]
MDQLIASLTSILFCLIAIVFGVAEGVSHPFAARLGIAPHMLQIGAAVIFIPLALLYFFSYKTIVIAPALRRWAEQNNVTLGKIRTRSRFSAPPATHLGLAETNQYQSWYSAELLSGHQVTGTAYFRLLTIMPLGIAIIRASAVT